MKNYIKYTVILSFFLSCFLVQKAKAQLEAYEANLRGQYEITAGAGGSNQESYTIKIHKPAGATTVHKIYMYNAGRDRYKEDEYDEPAGEPPSNIITVDGNDYVFPLGSEKEAISEHGYHVFGYSGEVAGNMKTKLDNASQNTNISFTIKEGSPRKNDMTDGVGIVVIWNNPTKPLGSHFMYMGMKTIESSPNGTAINIPISPIDKTLIDFEPILGIGISHSTGGGGTTFGDQWSIIKVNNQILTEKAGGSDDGDLPGESSNVNGTLITLGGFGDDPYSNDEDELFNINHLLQGGEESLNFEFIDANENNDDYINVIYFSGVGVTPTCTDSGITSVDLNSLLNLSAPLPPDVIVEWWTSPTRDLDPTNPGTKVTDPTDVTDSGVYYAFFYDTAHDCYNTDNSTARVVVNILPPCYCTEDPTPGTPAGFTKVGISTMKGQTDGWPENIGNGFLTMDSKTKGFVITRVQHVGGGTDGAPASTDAIANPKEGMLVYDIQDDCVKLFNGEIWNCLERSCNK